MANVAYPPFFPAQILDGDGQPVANGSIRAAFAGSDVPAPLFTPDGTALGSSVTLNSSGEAVFCLRAGTAYKLTCLDAQGATVWVRDNVRVTTSDSGMANPMEAAGDIIVGAVDGQPERLAPPANASFLRSYKNSDNVPVIKWSQLKAGANVTITDAGTQVTVAADTQEGDHKTQVSSADATPNYLYDKIETFDAPSGLIRKGIHGNVDGSKTLQLGIDATSATNGQVLTAEDIDGVCFPKWKNPTGGMTNPMTTAGDIIVGGASGTPDRLGAGTDGNVLTLSSGAPTWAAPATQTGDHKLLTTSADTSAGYLGAKLTAGSNVTLTTNTDGDGVQTLEISAAGGGGGGGGKTALTTFPLTRCSRQPINGVTHYFKMLFPDNFTPESVSMANDYSSGGTSSARMAIYVYTRSSGLCQIVYDTGDVTFTWGSPFSANFTHVNTYHASPVLERGIYVVGFWSNYSQSSWPAGSATNATYGCQEVGGKPSTATLTLSGFGTTAGIPSAQIVGTIS